MKIVILHGWGHNAALWKTLADKFGKDAEAINLPGFGNEALIDDNWGIPEYASWVKKRIEKNKQVVLVGHSFGGRVAAEIASKQPKWLKGLVLTGAPCLHRPSLKVKFRIKIYKLLKVFLPSTIRKLFFTKELKDANSRNLEKIFRKTVVYDQTRQLKKIKIPSILIWGKEDDQVPLRIAYEMRDLVKQSELKIVDQAGHNVYLEKPDLFYGYIKNFIQKLQ